MNRLVIDCETIGNVKDHSTLRVYDVAWQIVDKDFKVLCTRHFLVDEFFNDSELMATAYYSWKKPKYYLMLANKEVQQAKFINVYNQLVNDCKQFNVKQAWAYNAGFDRAALNRTIEIVSNGWRKFFMPYGVQWNCIQTLCCSTILDRPSYFKFITENDQLKTSGNLPTSAESAYRYMVNDPQYKEDHTALEDVKIERELLRYGITRKTKGKQTKIKKNAWAIPQKKFKQWQKDQEKKVRKSKVKAFKALCGKNLPQDQLLQALSELLK